MTDHPTDDVPTASGERAHSRYIPIPSLGEPLDSLIGVAMDASYGCGSIASHSPFDFARSIPAHERRAEALVALVNGIAARTGAPDADTDGGRR